VPKDHHQRARDRDVAKRAAREKAAGDPPSYEHLSEEIRPLDQINVFRDYSPESECDPTPAIPAQPEKIRKSKPIDVRRKGFSIVVRFPIKRGVTVSVRLDDKSKMGVVEALEAALADSRTRSDLPAPVSEIDRAPKKASTTIPSKRPTKGPLAEP
jgi:hypothetical protein